MILLEQRGFIFKLGAIWLCLMVGVITVVRDQVVWVAAQSRIIRCVTYVLLCVFELTSCEATARAVVVVMS